MPVLSQRIRANLLAEVLELHTGFYWYVLAFNTGVRTRVHVYTRACARIAIPVVCEVRTFAYYCNTS
jgi:hypothetical protein